MLLAIHISICVKLLSSKDIGEKHINKLLTSRICGRYSRSWWRDLWRDASGCWGPRRNESWCGRSQRNTSGSHRWRSMNDNPRRNIIGEPQIINIILMLVECSIFFTFSNVVWQWTHCPEINIYLYIHTASYVSVSNMKNCLLYLFSLTNWQKEVKHFCTLKRKNLLPCLKKVVQKCHEVIKSKLRFLVSTSVENRDLAFVPAVRTRGRSR